MEEHVIEFNQLAMTHAQGSDVMLNRVMTKDNIALAVLLETREGTVNAVPEGVWTVPAPSEAQQSILVATAHIHWDPEFCDVKLIQVSKRHKRKPIFIIFYFKIVELFKGLFLVDL